MEIKACKVSALLCPQLVETNMVTSTGVLDKDHPLMKDGLLTVQSKSLMIQ